MKQTPVWVVIVFLAIHSLAKSDEEWVMNALIGFISKLANSNGIPEPNPGWNPSSFPCQGQWKGITCDDQRRNVKGIALNGYNFSGVLDARLLCSDRSLSASLSVINISSNGIHGENLEDIGNCSALTHLLVAWNQLSGIIPKSISQLKNLKVLDVSHNNFTGPLPDKLPGNLMVFLAQDNQFSGTIPSFNLSGLSEFNVSYNNLIGPIPREGAHFNMSSFIHNPRLCGPPLPENCTSVVLSKDSVLVPAPPPKLGKKGSVSSDQILMFSGYAMIALAILAITIVCVCKRVKAREQKPEADCKVAAIDESLMRPSFSTVELKGKSDFALSVESGQASASLTVLTSPRLRFEDLLQAPAELLGRGKHGSVYKVECHGSSLAVKRIKDWPIKSNEFRERMRRLNQVKHPGVLPAVAFYSSRDEKLIVYEYKPNGSLFRLIHSHGDQMSQRFDWGNRISAAATIAEALAFMHKELQHDGIPHGNLKSSNILLNNNMEPCISEYGLMLEGNQVTQGSSKALFKADTYAFGVILLELLTGRMALDNGLDLANWVLAVVREEWTAEVFDKKLLCEGASEERMLNALQVAIRCVDRLSEARPSMKDVASAIVAIIRDDDEQSMDVSDLSLTRSFADV